MLRIGREIVPEMLEVDALAAGHELERRLAVEVEMPLVAKQENARGIADAGQERVHQRNALDVVRILRRVRVRDHEPDVVPDDDDLLEAERLGERMDVLRRRLLVVEIGRASCRERVWSAEG